MRATNKAEVRMNVAVASHRLPASLDHLTPDDLHNLDLAVNEVLRKLVPGHVISFTRIPVREGVLSEVILRRREDGMIN